MPIENGKYVPPNWTNNTSPAINAAELNAMSTILSKIPVANGGTGATTVAAARNNLGLGNTSGPVPIASGGTGANNVQAALSALLAGTKMVISTQVYGTDFPSSAQEGQLFFRLLE